MTNKGSYITNKDSDKKAIIDRFKLFNPKMSEEEVVEFVEEYLDPAIEPFKEYLGNVDVDLKV